MALQLLSLPLAFLCALFPSFRFDANWTPRTEGYVRCVVIFSLFRRRVTRVAGHFQWCIFLWSELIEGSPGGPAEVTFPPDPSTPCSPTAPTLLCLYLGLTPILFVTAAGENLSYWILAVEVVSTRPTCSFHPLLSANLPLQCSCP